MQKKKSGVKKCLEILPLRGGGGRLMGNAILNFHFDYLNPSLIEINFQEQTCRRTTGRPILFICIFYANPTKKDLKTSFEA